MKKIISIVLLCAMVLATFASCGSMQAGELDVNNYATEAGATNVSFKTELDDDADKSWTGRIMEDLNGDGKVTTNDEKYIDADTSWYTGDQTEYEISTGNQLRAIIKIVDGLAATGEVAFEDVTIKLANDIDLGGHLWTSGHSQKYFGGTFDGQGYAIGNFKMEVSGAGYQGFFGSLNGNACIKDVSLVDATYTNRLSANKSDFAVLSSRVNTVSGQTVTISNVYADVEFVVEEDALVNQRVGAFITTVQGNGDLLIENCENAANVTANGASMAGFISYASAANNITVRGCTVSGDWYSSAGKTAGGIIGYCGTLNGALLIEDCAVTGDFICDGDVRVATQVGGIIGNPATVKKHITIRNCSVEGEVKGGDMCGGIIGYQDKNYNLTIDGCTVSGSVSTGRSGGGIVGAAGTTKNTVTITNCEVTADLYFELTDKKNNNGGGIIGRLLASKSIITNNVVDAYIEAYFAASEAASNASSTSSLIAQATGEVWLANNTVAGSLDITNEDKTNSFFSTGAIVGYGEAAIDIRYAENNVIDPDYTTYADELVPFAGGYASVTWAVGYQTKDNGDGTYDLRYVFGMTDDVPAVGVTMNVRFTDENGVFDEYTNTRYAQSVYSKIYATEAGSIEYKAEDLCANYLYTVAITNIPNEYTFDDGNLQIIARPFHAVEEDDGTVTKTLGAPALTGEKQKNTSAKDVKYTMDDFTPDLPAKYMADGAYKIDSSYITDQFAIKSVTADKKECSGAFASGEATIPRHYYIDQGAGDWELSFFTYTFNVEEAGVYDLCVDMRMKGSGADFNGSNTRQVYMLVNSVGGEGAYFLNFNLDSVASIKSESAGSYADDLQIYLEAGENTITFELDANVGCFHVRNLYLVKAD